ncbi:MAG: glycerophosphodiester phosphodiesterase family protein [Lentisphaeria bacterium]
MRLCAIQQPYPFTPEEAESAVDFLLSELAGCDSEMDVILLPEYSNCPCSFPPGESLPFAKKNAALLENAAIQTAQRCRAIVALSFCAPIGDVYRNTTRVFDRQGKHCGDYFKQQLTEREPLARQIDNSYALEFRPPEIIEVEGLRLGFITCYDAYFNEYIAHLAYRKPDLVLAASHQRAERADILEMQNRALAFHTNAFVLRASVGMGEGKPYGGCSMIVDPSGQILANAGSKNGRLSCEVGDLKQKYLRSDSFGGPKIRNDEFIEKGRTPWSYRPCGSAVRLDDARLPYPRICAHRGFNTVAPENSLPSFAAAIALGADEIELDLWPSKDGVPMILHDPTLNRISNASGRITDWTCAELKKLDFGASAAAAWRGLQIPTLEELLRKFPRQVVFNLHVKSFEESTISKQDFLQQIITLIECYDCSQHVYITGRVDIQEVLIEIAPDLPRCMAGGPNPEKMDIVEKAIAFHCQKLQFMKPHYSAELIEQAHTHGIRCNMFWSDEPEETKAFLKAGIDTILTNDFLQIQQAAKPYRK